MSGHACQCARVWSGRCYLCQAQDRQRQAMREILDKQLQRPSLKPRTRHV